jgi:peptide/nickel transport system substrate-binding protein
MLARREILALAAGAALLAAVPVLAQDKDTLVIAVPADIQSWDPIATNSSPTVPVLRTVFDAPLTQTPDLKLVPNLIAAWKWIGEDGLRLELTFRDDVYFHNGDKFTAEDFRFTYVERLRQDEKLPFSRTFTSTIDDIEIQSPTKALVRFKKPMPTVLQWWAFLGQYVVPKKYFTAVGRDAFLEKPVGTGPYRFVEYQRGSRIVVEAFDKYWNGAPKVKRVIFEIIREPSARTAAIQSRRVDIALNVPIREAERLAKTPGLVSRIEPTAEIVMLHAKNEGGFKDINVRLAAHHAIDKAGLARALFGGKAVPITIPGIPSTPGYPKDFAFAYDPKVAADYLAKSGYSVAKPVKIKFVATNGAFPNDYDVARAIVAMWKRVGIDAELEPVELTKYYQMSRGGLLPEATLFTWSNATNDPEFYTGYILNPALSFSVWKSPDMGEMLGKLFSEPNYEKRIAGYAQASRYAVEKGYNIPLLQAVGTAVHTDAVNFTWYQNTWFDTFRIAKK